MNNTSISPQQDNSLPSSAHTNLSQLPVNPQNKLPVALAVAFLICAIVFGFGGYYLGNQSSAPQPIVNESQDQTSPSPVANNSNTIVSEGEVHQQPSNCNSTFSSKYLKLAFKFDGCIWKLDESLLTSQEEVYSIIYATHSSGQQLVINASSMGASGNYPGCYEVDDITMLDNDVVRVQMINDPIGNGASPKFIYYLNSKNDYAIKSYSGKYGDVKFKEYFTFLNPDSYPTANMCWRSVGINPISIQKPTEEQTKSQENYKDITILIEKENVSNEDFIKAADMLAVDVYSSLAQ